MSMAKHRLLVVGGNGFVGSRILQYAVQSGVQVRSLNRSGRPKLPAAPWIDRVEWLRGDVFNAKDLTTAVNGVTGVISTVGAFGDNAFMEKMCGDATIEAAKAAKQAGVTHFVFISNSRVGSCLPPSWAPLYGYYHGKQRAEQTVHQCFPATGVALRPGFIYGVRRVNPKCSVPLQLVGTPMAYLARHFGVASSLVTRLPLLGHELQAAVPVEVVAKSALLCAMGMAPTLGALKNQHDSTSLDTTAMLRLAASFPPASFACHDR